MVGYLTRNRFAGAASPRRPDIACRFPIALFRASIPSGNVAILANAPKKNKIKRFFCCALVIVAAMALAPPRASADSSADSRRFLPQILVSSTIPPNGDLNPYGIAFVPPGFPTAGALRSGDVLVSNFNNSNNLQGTGTTIITLRPSGGAAAPDKQANVFFQGKPPLGLTTALGVLQRGFVVVGSVTTLDGTSRTVAGGPLLFIDQKGMLVYSFSTNLDGPWDLEIIDNYNTAKVFVSNVLNGTVIRIDVSLPNSETVKVTSVTQIAAGYQHRTDPAALVLGPTGLALDSDADVLYVASTADNAIFALSNPGSAGPSSGRGKLVFTDPHLRGPLGLALAPNGNLLTSNGDAVNPDPAHPSEIIEFTKSGKFVGEYNIHQNQGGAFGIATFTLQDKSDEGRQINLLGVVNDNASNVSVTTIDLP
jgi:DNA-binding beta-propeller fold protein YncE